jgi:anaerobic glycerol-3-phosphate dehydrogenase
MKLESLNLPGAVASPGGLCLDSVQSAARNASDLFDVLGRIPGGQQSQSLHLQTDDIPDAVIDNLFQEVVVALESCQL